MWEKSRGRDGAALHDSRLVWLPLQFALRPEDHDTQEELDELVERAVGRSFTNGNRVWYIINAQFQSAVVKSIRDAQDYHVLWIHDFRGRNALGEPDAQSLRFVIDAYLDAAKADSYLQTSATSDKHTPLFRTISRSGQLTIHQAEAAPGSSLSSLLEVVDLLRRTGDSSQSLTARSLVLPEQTIPVQVRQGFVAHEGLIMELSGYRMKTSGAVGLNKELQMVIEVPLEKSTAAGSGRSLKVPLRGTMTQPQPDTGALLQNLGTQKIQENLGDQVDKTLNKQLNKLFDKF